MVIKNFFKNVKVFNNFSAGGRGGGGGGGEYFGKNIFVNETEILAPRHMNSGMSTQFDSDIKIGWIPLDHTSIHELGMPMCNSGCGFVIG